MFSSDSGAPEPAVETTGEAQVRDEKASCSAEGLEPSELRELWEENEDPQQ